MVTIKIRGVDVDFPFTPYPLQVNFMEKVIQCLQEEKNGVLESPTGTGKTLSLLCSSLAWILMKKAEIQASRVGLDNEYLKEIQQELGKNTSSQPNNMRTFCNIPTIIYTSRTHSQLLQAMNELKRTNYKFLKASILGSREQMCIDPDVINADTSNAKIQLCRMKVKTRTCYFYNQVEKKSLEPDVTNCSVMDIEDLVTLGKKHKFCPYYMSRELKQRADIVFMPYNYVLDPKARKSFNLDLNNSIIILDEAHNVEKVCEESASFQLKSVDIALAIAEVTDVMKLVENDSLDLQFVEQPKDFTPEDLCHIKEFLINFEKALNAVPLTNPNEGVNFPGTYIFEMFEKAGVNFLTCNTVVNLVEKISQFLTAVSSSNGGPFVRNGSGLHIIEDLLRIVFLDSNTESYREKIDKCYKVHITMERPWELNNRNQQSSVFVPRKRSRILSYWCFNPGFGMNMLMNLGVKCVILTSGTLAPLRPLISELGINISVQLENPHIVQGDQVCVKIIPNGPDDIELNCNYQNRDNPYYLNSLGRSLIHLIKFVPHGVLIFFPSYPIMQNSKTYWEENNIWSEMNKIKPVFVEPKMKNAFNTAMVEYYKNINDPVYKGAVFMGVCRGKLAEGLDFADANGRAVIIIGLPYPPMLDPKIILKKKYLDICQAKNKEYCNGEQWYSLEACRAVNQAIGRVIRHRNDYGAILLLDSRFDNLKIRGKLSRWLRDHIEVIDNFGIIINRLKSFFTNLEKKFPEEALPKREEECCSTDVSLDLSLACSSACDSNSSSTSAQSSSISQPLGEEEVKIYKRPRVLENLENVQTYTKRKKITLIRPPQKSEEETEKEQLNAYITMVKQNLDHNLYVDFLKVLQLYKKDKDVDRLCIDLERIFKNSPTKRSLVGGISHYVAPAHQVKFEEFLKRFNF